MKSSCKVIINNINNNNNKNNNNNNNNNNNLLFCLFHFHPTGHITSFQIFSTLFKNNFSIMLAENIFRIFFQAFIRFVSFILYCSMFRILFIKFMFSWEDFHKLPKCFFRLSKYKMFASIFGNDNGGIILNKVIKGMIGVLKV